MPTVAIPVFPYVAGPSCPPPPSRLRHVFLFCCGPFRLFLSQLVKRWLVHDIVCPPFKNCNLLTHPRATIHRQPPAEHS